MSDQVKERSFNLSSFLSGDEMVLVRDYHSSNVSTDMRVLTVHKDGRGSVADGKTDYSPEYLDLAKRFNSLMSFN